MCGIAGLVSERPIDEALIGYMTDAIAHRGPDDLGSWTDESGRVGLGHRRLSIVDLSPLGHQPMASRDGRWVISYNGEIYNHQELRAELSSAGIGDWRGHSDTETLVEAIAAWGLETTLRKSVGMFALALWDRKDRQLRLARDRFGEKPLYYGWVGGDFAFASELKAIRKHPRFDNPVRRDAVRLLLARNYIPAPLTIYEKLFKLEPGCILTIATEAHGRTLPSAPRADAGGNGIRLDRYWSYRDVVARGLDHPISDEREAEERLEQVISAAIAGQSVADVPIGAFLSGGIDSSTIVALYQAQTSRPIRTFSIGFEEAAFNEAAYAKEVAAHLGTIHNERYVTAREALEVIPSLASMYDEPFADSSQIPTHIVSRFAREQVTVAISGDGGDELFGGYNRYFLAARLWAQMNRLPASVRKSLAAGLGRVPPSAWTALSAVLPGGRRPPHFGMKVQKSLGTMRRASALDDIYNSFLDEWTVEGTPVVGAPPVPEECAFDLLPDAGAPDTARMMYCDAVSYLPDDILCKVDRASMAVSLETRVPFLDHRVAELAACIPLDMKIREGKGKHVLRRILGRHVPPRLFERPKAGFGIPVGEWMRGPLRDWCETLLSPDRLRNEGYLSPDLVRTRWDQHLSGGVDHSSSLWGILMFQAWLEANGTHETFGRQPGPERQELAA